uniref:Uncharacterized protein n=1 Tax=Phalansterium sp. PJK-2012 TaxID=1267188 RepID=T1QDX9_9EUKA|nr:hypothetical protein [Phalansterium sp. PJK-2012]
MILFYNIIDTNFFGVELLMAILCMNFYFHELRVSLKEYTIVLEDIGEKELSEWEHRSVLTEEELAKMELEENKLILGITKMYSLTEERFVNFSVFILIQHGNESSLLKRGVYVNICPSHYKHCFFIRSSQFQSAKGKNAKYNDDGGMFLSDPRLFFDIFNAATRKIEIDECNSSKKKEETKNDIFLANVFAREEYLIEVEHPSRDSVNEITNIVRDIIKKDDTIKIRSTVVDGLNLMVGIMKEIYASDFGPLFNQNYDPHRKPN